VVTGPTQSGKSTLVCKLINRRNELFYPPVERVIWCYGQQPPPAAAAASASSQDSIHGGPPRAAPAETLLELDGNNSNSDGLEYVQGLPDIDNYTDVVNDQSAPPHVLVVLDDLMNESSKSTDILDMFTRKNHHQNISCILILQNFFHKNLRSLTLNSKYIVVLKNPRESSIMSVLGRQMNSGKRNLCLEQAYSDCCKTPHGYVVLDLSQTCDDSLRIRSSLFPEDCVFYMKK
jgi:energy-coupling factor transporter ATP-binding protein EcfA2